MNNSPLGSKNLKLIYYRYKESKLASLLIFVVLFLVAFILIWWVVVPQVQKYVSIQEEVSQLRNKVSLLRSNLEYVKSSNAETVDADFQTALSALPAEKDFEGILNAISASAIKSGVALDDFTFTIGKLATESATANSELKPILIRLGLKSSVDTAKVFIHELDQKVPISDITLSEVNESDSSKPSTIEMSFYYKPLTTLVLRDDAPIPRLKSEDKALLEIIKTWKSQTTGLEELAVVASAAAAL